MAYFLVLLSSPSFIQCGVASSHLSCETVGSALERVCVFRPSL